jgi:hypothetical protein
MSDTLTFELVELETWFNDKAKCQAPHEDPRNLECSHEVTHVFRFCKGPATVCAKTAEYVSVVLHGDASSHCSYCGDLCHRHWDLIPV